MKEHICKGVVGSDSGTSRRFGLGLQKSACSLPYGYGTVREFFKERVPSLEKTLVDSLAQQAGVLQAFGLSVYVVASHTFADKFSGKRVEDVESDVGLLLVYHLYRAEIDENFRHFFSPF